MNLSEDFLSLRPSNSLLPKSMVKDDGSLDQPVRNQAKRRRRKLTRSVSDLHLADVATDLLLSQACIYLLHNASVKNFSRLRQKLACGNRLWMKVFLDNDGLELLFECLENLALYKNGCFSNLVLRLECVICIKTVMNSVDGLVCLVGSSLKYATKFAHGKYSDLLLSRFYFSQSNGFFWSRGTFYILMKFSELCWRTACKDSVIILSFIDINKWVHSIDSLAWYDSYRGDMMWVAICASLCYFRMLWYAKCESIWMYFA